MKGIKVRTSLSLPNEMVKNLQKVSKEIGFSVNEIAILCLRKMFGEETKKLKLSGRETVQYNQNWPCDGKIFLYLSQKEHLSLRIFRMNSCKSVSYHLYLSILAYLQEITILLGHNYTKRTEKLSKLKRNLCAIHQKIVFKTKKLFGFSVVYISSG